MILYYYASLIVWITSFAIAFFILIRARRPLKNSIFAFLMLSLGIWAFGYSKYFINTDPSTVLFWSRISHLGAIVALALLTHFTFLVLSRTKEVLLVYGSILFVLPFVFSDLFIPRVVPKPFTVYYLQPGKLYSLFILSYVVWTIFCDYLMWQRIRQTSGIYRNQLKYFFLASLCGVWGGATTFPLVYDIRVPPFGIFLMPFYAPLMAQAIFKYRLMDINIVFKKGTVYAILTFLALIPCMLIIVFAQRYYFGETNYAFSSLVFSVLALAAYFFARMKPITEESVEKTLFRETYEYKTLLREFSKKIVSFLEEKDLINSICNTLSQALGIKGISFLLFDREKKIYHTRFSKNLNSHISFPKDNPFFKWLEKRDEIVIKEELERTIDNHKINPLIQTLNSMQSEVCIPLMIRNELIGIINLGGKESGHMYSHEDIELLSNLARQTAIALENARLYEDLKRSKLIIRRADKLASLGTLTAGLAHEIKNPLVAIKTFVQLLPERFEDEEFRNYFLNVASGEVDRLSDLVNALLDFARPSQPSFQTGNVNEIMDNVILLIENEVKRKNLKIKRHYSSDLPQIMLDPEQIKQVFLNIILNAAEATPENGSLMVETRGLDKDRSQEFIQVEIRDTGRGIPKDNLERIFEPFFTTKADGSGLGLAVSHHIIEEHHGYIKVESEVGGGTSFFINLPVNPLILARKQERYWSSSLI